MADRFLGVLDPAWSRERGGGKIKRGADRHYALAGPDQMALEYRMSEPWPADGVPGLLWVWATTSTLIGGDLHALIAGLAGCRPCAGWVWAKVDGESCDGCNGEGEHGPLTSARETCDLCDGTGLRWRPPRRMGLGQWSRVEHEHLILCRRGDVSVPPPPDRPRSMIFAPRGRHSEKPEAAWRVIERVSRAVLPGVIGCEWNARVQRPGWAAFGRLDGEDKEPRFAAAKGTSDG